MVYFNFNYCEIGFLVGADDFRIVLHSRRVIFKAHADARSLRIGRDGASTGYRSELAGERAVDRDTPTVGSAGTKVPARALGAGVVGALALGALAIGALAVGRMAIGRIAIGRGRVDQLHIRRLAVDELKIGRIVRD